MLGRPADDARASTCTLGTWIDAGAFSVDAGLRVDPLSLTFVLLVTFVGTLIHVYSVAYMEHDADRRRFFAYLNLFVAAMLAARAGRQLPAAVRRLGGRRPGVVPAHRVLEPRHARTRSPRRRRSSPTASATSGLIIALMADVRGLRRGRLRDGARPAPTGAQRGHAHRDRPHAPARRVRQVGAVPAAVLARRRDGRPDAGLRAHPRRDHGHRRRLPRSCGPAPLFDARADAPSSSSSIVGAITLLFGAIVGCAKDDIKKALAASTMSQIGYMMLAAGPRPGRLRVRDLPPDHARLLQGRACSSAPARSCTAWTTRWTCAASAGSRRYMKITWVTFMASAGSRSSASRRSPGSGARTRSSRPRSCRSTARPWQPWVFGARRAARRRDHRVLHVAPVLHDVRGRAPLVRPRRDGTRAAPARVPEAHDRGR